MKKYNWEYGENQTQKYYECYINKDYLCICQNNWNPGVWFCIYQKENKNSVVILDKNYNDRISKKINTDKATAYTFSCKLLTSSNIDYLKRKLVHCYEHDKIMITP